VDFPGFHQTLVKIKESFLIGGEKMSVAKIVALGLMVAGFLGLIYGGFSYTKDTQQVKLGPIEMSVKEKKTVNVPMWAGVGAIVIGGGLLLLDNK
jgi:TRAP-type C4-dicarboxylate transport system permease small subunit